MQFIGSIEGMNFSPIAGYNQYLKSNSAFDVDSSEFDGILAKQTQAITNKSPQINGGIEMNVGFDEIFSGQGNAVSKNKNSTDNFMKKIGNSFADGINSVNQKAEAAESAQEALAMGENVSVHDVMIASEKAALSMQLALQLRNKILSAYSEINNVRV